MFLSSGAGLCCILLYLVNVSLRVFQANLFGRRAQYVQISPNLNMIGCFLQVCSLQGVEHMLNEGNKRNRDHVAINRLSKRGCRG